MTFIFNNGIPAAANNPSVDQPDMLQNNISTEGILAVDHYTFNTPTGGIHTQVHLGQFTTPDVINAAGSQGSVIFGFSGTADNAHAQCFFKNPNGTFLMSANRAFGSFQMTNGNMTLINGMNSTVSVVAGATSGTGTITLSPNVVSGTNYVVIASCSVGNAVSTSITSSTVFTLTAVVNSIVSYIVLQI